jgi:peptidoglycan/xylan/chitin deacetylase (PgdA/CDA1 family)
MRYLALSSVILFCASIIIFILILVNQLGYFNISSAKDNPFDRPKVSILLSDYTYQFYKNDKGAFYQEMIDQWHQILKDENVTPKIIRDAELEKGLTETDVLIMPSSACLSNAQIASIRKFVSDGGGLIFSWAAGARREGGSWRGWEFVEELANIKIVSIDEKSPLKINYITLKTDSPVTAGLPSGLRLDIRSDDSEIYARSDSYDAFYSEWRLFPTGAERGYPPFTAINHNHFGKGKVLWFSFNTNRLLLEPANKAVLSKIAYNALNWMMGYPLGSIDNWPGSKSAAFFIDQDTEHEPANALELDKVVRSEGSSATFFCISSIFEKEPGILRALSPTIEIGSHLDTAVTLLGQSFDTQLARLKKSKESLEKITGKKIVGLKPAEEIYDNNTIKALMKLGYLYMVTNPRSPVAVPAVISADSVPKDIVKLEHILTPPASDFVIMPRLVRDDYLIMSTDKIVDKEKIAAIMKADFLNIYNLGGVYIMPVHTQLLSGPSFSIVIKELIKFAKDQNIWMATGREIAEWWLERNKLEHRITGFDEKGFSSTIVSRNSVDMTDVGLTYFLDKGVNDIAIEANGENFSQNSSFDKKAGALKIRLPRIKSAEKINLKFTLD